MRRVAFAAAFAACVGVSGAAVATDLSLISLKDTPEPSYEFSPIWAGLYVGVHGGWGRGNVDVVDIYDYNGDPRTDTAYDAAGGIVGVQIGYNRQRGNLVYGVEAALGYMDLSGDKFANLVNPTVDSETEAYNPNRNIDATYSLSGGFYGDLTGRLGYATDRAMFFVKGGAAFLKTETSSNYVGANCTTTTWDRCGSPTGANPSTFDDNQSDTLFGWTIGIGGEYKLTQALSLKLEYQHFNFGTFSRDLDAEDEFRCYHNGGTCTAELTSSTDTDLTVDTVKLGLNYQLDYPEDELK